MPEDATSTQLNTQDIRYPNDLWADIETLINVAQPNSIVIIGDIDEYLFINYQTQKKVLGHEVELTFLNPKQNNSYATIFNTTKQFDLAVAANIFEHADHMTGTNIISRLRDVVSKQFCIALAVGSSQINNQPTTTWQLGDLFALGLQRVANYKHYKQTFGLFKFNINNYKKTPDWLNADNWANPEMWGKYSW